MGKTMCYLILTVVLFAFPNRGHSQLEGMLDQQQMSKLAERIAEVGKKRIAVVDFTDLQGNVTELGRFLAEEFSVAFAGAGKGLAIIDRGHLRAILAEHRLALTGIVDPETARKIGKIAGVQAIVTGSVTPFGDSIRVSFKILDSETAMIIAASSGNIARTAAISELLGRGIESSQPVSHQASTPASGPYIPKQGVCGVVEDSYLRVVVLNVSKSGNRFVAIQLEYQNKTDKEIKLDYDYHNTGNCPAVVVDDMGNDSRMCGVPECAIPPKGTKALGLGFSFRGIKELGNIFNLTIFHKTSPPGSVSFTNLKAKTQLN